MTITSEETYLLNNKMGAVAAKVQLGTLIANAEAVTAAEIAIADGALLVGNASAVGVAIVPTGDVTITNAGVTAIGANKVTEAMLAAQAITNGGALNVRRTAVGLFNPSAVSGDRTIAAHTIAIAIPDKSIITRVYIEVLTTFTSATDAGTIALSLNAANDVKTATAISAGGDFWDAGFHDPLQAGAAANFIKLTAARQLTATVAVEALTAGKMLVFVDYVLGG